MRLCMRKIRNVMFVDAKKDRFVDENEKVEKAFCRCKKNVL